MSRFRPSARGESAVSRTRVGRRATVLLSILAGVLLTGTTAAAAFTPHKGIPYDLNGSAPPKPQKLNRLDLYTPAGSASADRRPVVVYIHGGNWRAGDKLNKIAAKTRLFTNAGYVFASINYRLSPNPVNTKYPSGRIRFPAHPADVGEALAWISRNVANYGGDPTRILLLGHSAGAHLASLVATDPAYVAAFEMNPEHVIGVASLDTDAYDVRRRATYGGKSARNAIYNAFATPGEDAIWDTWSNASPIRWADRRDPRFLLVTQAGANVRVNGARAMAERLGQGPQDVLALPYSHARINDALGSKDDPAGETQTVMSFFAERVGASVPARVWMLSKKHRQVKIRAGKRKSVKFRFRAEGATAGYRCRLGKKADFKPCSSPKRYRLKRGSYQFAVRAVASNGTGGPMSTARVRVERKRK